MARILFRYGTSEEYNALAQKDENTLYFLTDKQKIYKGSFEYGGHVAEFVNSIPMYEDAQTGVLYIVDSNDKFRVFVKGPEKMVPVTSTEVGDGAIYGVSAFRDSVLETSEDGITDTDEAIPTSGATLHAIEEHIAPYNNTFSNVSVERAEDNTGNVLTFQRISGDSTSVKISDLFLTSVSYDEETHIMSLYVQGVPAPITIDLNDLVQKPVNTEQVNLATGFTVTHNIGGFHRGDTITIDNSDPDATYNFSNLQELLHALLNTDIYPTSKLPSASISTLEPTEQEVGTVFTPRYTISLDPGAYLIDGEPFQATEIVPTSYQVVDSDSHVLTTASGSFEPITISDSTNYSIRADISYSAGIIPDTYLHYEYPDAQIPAGVLQVHTNVISGYRNSYMGYKTSDTEISNIADITVSEIKALDIAAKELPDSMNTTNMKQIVVVVPHHENQALSIIASTGIPANVQGPINLMIGGINDYAPIEYDVFYVDNDIPDSGNNTYTLIWNRGE